MTIEFPIIAINGQSGATISPLDRGFAYGDGVYETCRVAYGKVPLWQLHKERLLTSCQRLGIACDADQLDLYCNELLTLPEINQHPDAVLKVTVTRGVGGRGYKIPPVTATTYCLAMFEGNPLLSNHYTQGVNLRICQHRLSSNPALAGLKHMNRLEQVLARSEWGDEYHEGLLLDALGNVIEATSSNLFVVIDDELITPDLSHSGVEGVMRRLILENLAPALGLVPCIKTISLMELQKADEVFICNSVAGISPVLSIAFSPTLSVAYVPKFITRQLQAKLERFFSDSSRMKLSQD